VDLTQISTVILKQVNCFDCNAYMYARVICLDQL
jgi:hypothetical protein